jgi:tetratricopeptide (TPR) repeat protein
VVVRNSLISSVGNIPVLFTSNYYAPNMQLGLYRPLVTASYAMNYAFGALNPWGYHVVNILLHALNAGLVFLLVRWIGGSLVASAVAGSLFAVHAIHTEAVANVAGRPELLAAFFFLLALLCHVASSRRGIRPHRVLYAASLTSYFLGLLSKENAITLLGVILLYDAVFDEALRGSFWQRLKRSLKKNGTSVYAGYLLVTLAYLGLRYVSLGGWNVTPPTSGIDNPLTLLSFPWSVLNALQVAWHYVWLLLFPLHLSYDYSYAQIPLFDSWTDPRCWTVLGLTAAACWGMSRSYRLSPYFFFALGFYAVTFSIVSNLFVRIGTIMGERLIYLPSVAFCLAVGWLLGRGVDGFSLLGAKRRALAFVLAGLLVAAHGYRSVARNADWSTKERLYLHDVAVSSRSAKALNNAGWILIDRHLDVARGVTLVEEALRIWPDHPEWLDSLGWGYYKLGRYPEAQRVLERSLELGHRGATLEERRAHLRAVEEALRRDAEIAP